MDEQREQNRGGRPRVGLPVQVRLPDQLHDALCREAIRRDISVSAVVRERLERDLRQPTEAA